MQNKRDILLIHGALGSKIQFDALAPFLSSKYNLHTLDLPSHGVLSYQRNSFSMFNFANYAHNYILNNNLETPYVFGFSMGGFVALTLQSQSALFSRIMTLNTKFQWDIETVEKEKMMLNADKILEKVPHYAQYLISQHGEENWKNLLSEHKSLMSKIAKANPLSEYSLSKIQIPVLICRGSEDNMVTKYESIDVCHKLIESNYFEFSNTQHPIEKIDLEILSNKMIEFFN